MKRIFSFVIFVFGLLFFSCGNVAGSGGTGPAPTPTPDPDESKADWSGQTVDKDFSTINYMFAVTNTTRNLDITLPDGNYDIFMVEINNSSYIVPANQNQWIVAGGFLNSERSAYDADGFVLASDLSDEINFSDFEFPEDDGRVKREHFVDTFVPPPFYGNVPSLRSASNPYIEPPMFSYTSGDIGTRKEIYVDKNLSTYEKKWATLQAVGTRCYVWVVDGYFGSGFKQVDQQKVDEMKNQFDGFYEYVRYVFGEESDDIIDNGARVPMDDKKVNIVVYDIKQDATETQTGGTLGYFASKDYYAQESDSNKGKYFYVDSYFAKKYPKDTYSTLAHEFQHMISYNEKKLKRGVDGYNGYNEMLSMLCEDMLQGKIGCSDVESPKGRFLTFLSNYYKYGIFDYPNDAGFYSVTYMFGAFLARNYGGAKLVHHMATNSYRNAESITAALDALGYEKTFDDVLKEYAKALVLENNAKTFNKDAKTYSDFKYGIDDYDFPMTKFDIFNFPARGESYSMKVLLRNTNNITNKSSRKSLHAEGIIPYYVGRADRGGDLRLTFSSPANPNSKAYILMQKNR